MNAICSRTGKPMGGETQIVDKIKWHHPHADETGSEFCRRMGWSEGTTLLYSGSADGYGRPDNPRWHKILKLDATPKNAPAHKPGTYIYMLCCGSRGYRTHLPMVDAGLWRRRDRPFIYGSGYETTTWETTWPWAKAPPHWRRKRIPAGGR